MSARSNVSYVLQVFQLNIFVASIVFELCNKPIRFPTDEAIHCATVAFCSSCGSCVVISSDQDRRVTLWGEVAAAKFEDVTQGNILDKMKNVGLGPNWFICRGIHVYRPNKEHNFMVFLKEKLLPAGWCRIIHTVALVEEVVTRELWTDLLDPFIIWKTALWVHVHLYK